MTFRLMQFQDEDIQKLAKQKNALIGSEMGTGKTHQGIALDEHWWKEARKILKEVPPTLIVTPINTFSSWVDKFKMQAPWTVVEVIDRKNRNKLVQDIKHRRADVFIVNWDALRVMPELQQFTFNTIIADEVHRASNRNAQATLALKKLKTLHKLGMSGTMSGDKPQNLWSVLNWLWPQYYKSYWKFVNKYVEQEIDYSSGGAYRKFVGPIKEKVLELHDEMGPWYVRHLKREPCCEHHPQGVMSYLPEKTYSMIFVDLSPTQRRVYDQMKKQMVAWVGAHEDSPLVASVVVAQMTRLSQMALATPELYIVKEVLKDKKTKQPILDAQGNKQYVDVVKVKLIAPSSKIDAVKELIQDADEGKKFVVYTSSKQAAYLATNAFNAAGIVTEMLSGDSKDIDRQELTKNFYEGRFRVLVAVIQAAAEGIDGLQQSCDTAIFMDRSWSTIKNKQAEDRLHRDGQKNTVQIIDIIARNTLDFGRKQKLENKWAWIKEILGDNIQRKVLEDYYA